MDFNLEFDGFEELYDVLDDAATLKVVKQAVKTNTEEMRKKAVDNTKYFTGYWTGGKPGKGKFKKPTGATKQSIDHRIMGFGLTGEVSASTYYSGFVNWGTRKMTPRPFMTDAFNAQVKQFESDLRRVMD